MKQILVAALVFATMTAHAKSAPTPDDTAVRASPPCMVEVSTMTATRFLNVLYVRDIEIKNDGPNGLPGKTLVISMASNYHNVGEFGINYPTNQAAVDALRTLVKQINACR